MPPFSSRYTSRRGDPTATAPMSSSSPRSPSSQRHQRGSGRAAATASPTSSQVKDPPTAAALSSRSVTEKGPEVVGTRRASTLPVAPTGSAPSTTCASTSTPSAATTSMAFKVAARRPTLRTLQR